MPVRGCRILPVRRGGQHPAADYNNGLKRTCSGLKRTCSHARARAGADDIERMDDDEDMTKTVRGRKKTFTAGRPKLEPEPKVLSKATRIAPPKTLLPLPHAACGASTSR